jgi:type II secretory pathway pseudopilin PulG
VGAYSAPPRKARNASTAKAAGSTCRNRQRTFGQWKAGNPRLKRDFESAVPESAGSEAAGKTRLRNMIPAATRIPNTKYPVRFNWSTADSTHPATLARTEIQSQTLTNGRNDIGLRTSYKICCRIANTLRGTVGGVETGVNGFRRHCPPPSKNESWTPVSRCCARGLVSLNFALYTGKKRIGTE